MEDTHKTNRRPAAEGRTPDVMGEPEPWAGWETRLCLWSLVLGIGGLIVLALLLHSFLL